MVAGGGAVGGVGGNSFSRSMELKKKSYRIVIIVILNLHRIHAILWLMVYKSSQKNKQTVLFLFPLNLIIVLVAKTLVVYVITFQQLQKTLKEGKTSFMSSTYSDWTIIPLLYLEL